MQTIILIEPFGIETYVCYKRWLAVFRILIEPFGIETCED